MRCLTERPMLKLFPMWKLIYATIFLVVLTVQTSKLFPLTTTISFVLYSSLISTILTVKRCIYIMQVTSHCTEPSFQYCCTCTVHIPVCRKLDNCWRMWEAVQTTGAASVCLFIAWADETLSWRLLTAVKQRNLIQRTAWQYQRRSVNVNKCLPWHWAGS